MRNLTKLMIFGLGLAAIPSFADPSLCDAIAGNLVQNCGFELTDFTDWGPGGILPNNDGLTLVGNNSAGANSGQYYAALGSRTDVTLEQQISDNPGTLYYFSFFYATDGGVPADFTASWDHHALLTLPDPAGQPYTEYSFAVIGTGSDTITFEARNYNGWSELDDVSVAVPEPTFPWQGVLLLVALFGLSWSRRRTARRESSLGA